MKGWIGWSLLLVVAVAGGTAMAQECVTTPPPEGAVVLFDGTPNDNWVCARTDNPLTWLVAGGAMTAQPCNAQSKQSFGSHMLHIEFRIPEMDEQHQGQHRGNSGVYVQGIYEVQVLDSYNMEQGKNGCGAVYNQAVPLVNACLPPTHWQSYDIVFHAAKVNEAGEVTQKARITVLHNGVLIHDSIEIDLTPGGVSKQPHEEGPLMLQWHDNYVSYRNIWVMPLDK